MDRLAVAVAEHLEFDMPGIAQIFFHVDGGVAERGLRLRTGLLHQRFELVLGGHDLHAAPAAARGRLDDDRIADLGRERLGLFEVRDRAVRARNQRQAQGTGGALGLDLVAHHPDMLGLRADEDQAVRLDDLGELGVLREEAVTGMDRIRARNLGRRDDVGDVEIAVGRRRRPMQTAWSARRTCMASASAVECTATVSIPIS